MNITIIGAGLAGFAVADAVRELDDNAHIRLITADNADRYHKPMLSSAFAQQKTANELIRKDEKLANITQSFDVMKGATVTALDKTAKTLTLDNGQNLPFDKLVLAIGATPIVPTPLVGFKNLFNINHLTEFEKLRTHLATIDKPTVAVIGGGMVGVECAEDLQKGGVQAILVDRGDYPLSSFVPKIAGERIAERLMSIGVQYINNANVTVFDDDNISLDNGQTVSVNAVVLATGLVVDDKLFSQFGAVFDSKKGLAVNEHNLQVIDNPDIYAIGDCMNIGGMTSRFVAPHKAQAKAIALDIVGQTAEYKHNPPMIRLKNKSFTFVVNGKLSNDDWQTDSDIAGELILSQASGAKLQLKWAI